MKILEAKKKKKGKDPYRDEFTELVLDRYLELAQEEKEKELCQSRGNKLVKAGMLREEDKLCARRKGTVGEGVAK